MQESAESVQRQLLSYCKQSGRKHNLSIAKLEAYGFTEKTLNLIQGRI